MLVLLFLRSSASLAWSDHSESSVVALLLLAPVFSPCSERSHFLHLHLHLHRPSQETTWLRQVCGVLVTEAIETLREVLTGFSVSDRPECVVRLQTR